MGRLIELERQIEELEAERNDLLAALFEIAMIVGAVDEEHGGEFSLIGTVGMVRLLKQNTEKEPQQDG